MANGTIQKPSVVDAGTTATFTMAADSKDDHQITFNRTFASPPIVLAGLSCTSGDNATGRTYLSVQSGVTTTGATVRVYHMGNQITGCSIQWIAIG